MIPLEPQFSEACEVLEMLSRVLREGKSIALEHPLRRLEAIYQVAAVATRQTILTTLADFRCSEALPIFIRALQKDESALVRHEAAFAVGILGNESHTHFLVHAMLNDPHLMVRHEAATALATVGNESCISPLEQACTDQSVAVAESARFALHYVVRRISLKQRSALHR